MGGEVGGGECGVVRGALGGGGLLAERAVELGGAVAPADVDLLVGAKGGGVKGRLGQRGEGLGQEDELEGACERKEWSVHTLPSVIRHCGLL